MSGRTRPALHVQVKKPKRADIIAAKIKIIGKYGRKRDAALGIRDPKESLEKLIYVRGRYLHHGMVWAAEEIQRCINVVINDAWQVSN